jgi:hypothetical protein
MVDATSDVLDAAHLTALLRAVGVLQNDQVTGITVESSQ